MLYPLNTCWSCLLIKELLATSPNVPTAEVADRRMVDIFARARVYEKNHHYHYENHQQHHQRVNFYIYPCHCAYTVHALAFANPIRCSRFFLVFVLFGSTSLYHSVMCCAGRGCCRTKGSWGYTWTVRSVQGWPRGECASITFLFFELSFIVILLHVLVSSDIGQRFNMLSTILMNAVIKNIEVGVVHLRGKNVLGMILLFLNHFQWEWC